MIYILHVTKEGNYKGPSEYVHWPDVEIKAVDGLAQIEKKRFKETPQTMNIVSSRTDLENPDNEFITDLKGNINFSEITPDIAKKIHRQAGFIKVIQNGFQHVLKHEKDIKKDGYRSIIGFINEITTEFEQIYDFKGTLI